MSSCLDHSCSHAHFGAPIRRKRQWRQKTGTWLGPYQSPVPFTTLRLWFQCLFRSTLSPDFCTTGINHVGILVAMGERDPLLPDDKHYAFCGWCLRKRRKAILIPTVWMLANVDYEDLLTDFVGDFT